METIKKEVADLHGRYVIDAKGVIVGQISICNAFGDTIGNELIFVCSNKKSLRGTVAENRLAYAFSWALCVTNGASEGRVERTLRTEGLFLSKEPITLYDIIQ